MSSTLGSLRSPIDQEDSNSNNGRKEPERMRPKNSEPTRHHHINKNTLTNRARQVAWDINIFTSFAYLMAWFFNFIMAFFNVDIVCEAYTLAM